MKASHFWLNDLLINYYGLKKWQETQNDWSFTWSSTPDRMSVACLHFEWNVSAMLTLLSSAHSVSAQQQAVLNAHVCVKCERGSFHTATPESASSTFTTGFHSNHKVLIKAPRMTHEIKQFFSFTHCFLKHPVVKMIVLNMLLLICFGFFLPNRK